MVGRALPITNGYLVSLSMTQGPSDGRVPPDGNDGNGAWRSGYIQIRGSLDHRDLVCLSPASGAVSSWNGPRGDVVLNRSLPYLGDLVIVAVPRGSQWSLTLSDIPNPREAPAAWSFWEPAKQAELVAR
jgi:hypothetical protein